MSWRNRIEQIRIVVNEDTRRRQMAAIEDALAEAKHPARRRGRALAIALAVVLTVPVMAVAAENSQPGDFLYPVRQVFDSSQRETVSPDTLAPPDDEVTSVTEVRPPTGDEESRSPTPTTRPTVDTRPPERPMTTTTRPTTTTTVPRTTTTAPERPSPTRPPREG